jgi:hypothetical protein
MHDPDFELEQFLDQLAVVLARYQTARINLILLSQRRSPTPTVRTWAGAIDRLRAEQAAARDLIMEYADAQQKADHAQVPGSYVVATERDGVLDYPQRVE